MRIFFVGGIGQPPLRCLPDLRLLGVAGREPLGQQDLVGGRTQVAAQLPSGDSLEDPPEKLLELRDHVKGGGADYRLVAAAAHQLSLEDQGPLHADPALLPLVGLTGEGRDSGGHRGPGRAATLQQGPEGEKVVAQRLDQEVRSAPSSNRDAAQSSDGIRDPRSARLREKLSSSPTSLPVSR